MTEKEPSPDENEVLDFQFILIDELFKLIENGSFSQSLHIASVFLALRRLKANQYLSKICSDYDYSQI